MGLLYRLMLPLEIKRDEWKIRRELARLPDRSLADLGLQRADIRRVARRTACLGPSEVFLSDIFHRLRETEDARAEVAA